MSVFAGFLSYARLDDQYEDGRVTEFRQRLEAAVRQWTGEKDFEIFQDTKDIRWGERWRDRIERALLEDVYILIPILTPLHFNSAACREEYELFLKREQELGRDDLILPLYWLPCDILENSELRAADSWATGLAGHHRMDWRSFRWKGFDSPEVLQALDGLALQIKQTWGVPVEAPSDSDPASETAKQPRARRGKAHGRQRPKASPTAEAPTGGASPEQGEESKAGAEPPTCVVDAMGRGDYISLVEAVQQSNPGDRLYVRPGLYPGGLTLDKPLEIVGVGDVGDIVVQATGRSVIRFSASMGIVRNLTLRQIGGSRWYGVDVTDGRLVMEDCDISSQSLACVAVHGGGDPVVRRNRIHDGKEGGIIVYKDGRGTFEENEVFGNALAGVAVKEDGDPVMRGNRIYDGKQSGIFVYEGGRGSFEDNEVFGNAYAGVAVSEGGDPVVRRNRIHDGKQSGIYVYKDGRGTFEDNEVFGNAHAGVAVKEGGDPVVRRNRITGNSYEAVWIYEHGSGTFEDNDLRGNGLEGSWDISEDSTVTKARNEEDDGK